MRFPKPAAGRESAPERSPESAGHSFGIAVFIPSLFYAPEMIRPAEKRKVFPEVPECAHLIFHRLQKKPFFLFRIGFMSFFRQMKSRKRNRTETGRHGVCPA